MLAEEWFDHGGGIDQYVQGPTSPCVSFPYLFVLLRQQLAPENVCFLEQQYAAFKVVHTPLFKFEVGHTVDLLGSVANADYHVVLMWNIFHSRLGGCNGNNSSKFVEMLLEIHSWSMLFSSFTSPRRYFFQVAWDMVELVLQIYECILVGYSPKEGVLWLAGKGTRAAEDQISDIPTSSCTNLCITWSLTLKLMVVCPQRWSLMTFNCWADIFGIYCVSCLLQLMNQLQKARIVTPGLPRRITVCHFTLNQVYSTVFEGGRFQPM